MNIETAIRPDSVAIGAPAYHPAYSSSGHVVQVEACNGFTIGASGMVRDRSQLTIVWGESLQITEVPESAARSWLDLAARYRIEPISAEQAAALLAAAKAKKADAARQMNEAYEQGRIARAAFEADAASKIPAWAKAVIVAELIEDQSDSMTDYYGGKTVRTVILGFSKHTRDLFPELRQAARNFAETAALADAPETAENRQKWSMGGGYFLKVGGRYSNGWKVSKQSFYGNREPVKSLPFPADWHLAAPKAETAPAAAPGVVTPAGIRIEEHTHTKKGFQMFICIMPERVERDEFNRLRELAETLGGWYSKPWGKTPGGFAFKKRDAAETFANPEPSPNDDGPKDGRAPEAAPRAEAPARASVATGDKLRAMADAMQGEIDHKFRDRLTNTPKRQREADSARLDGYWLQRTQQALRALAAHHNAGTVPPELRGVTSKKAAHDLARSEIVRNGGYYDAGYDTGKPATDTPATRALWAMIAGQSEADKQAEALRRKVQALQFANIPGYFPTPRAVIDQMIDLADLPAGEFDMLEPEGGSGAILDVVKDTAPGAKLTTYERHFSLREILTAKGYALAGSDFMEAETAPRFDRVLMNPPFENGQDIDHVRHAFKMLRDGGRLVAVMSPGPFFRQDRKATEFRTWFDDCGGEKYDLPPGSFKQSGTGTATVLVVLVGDELAKEATPVSTAPAGGYRIGTSHFESLEAAGRYYGDPRGSTAADKVAEGEIHIGPPSTCEPDETVTLNREEGRYFIERKS
ncbi:hypothetical protein [Mesorhizobium sp. M1B.F.Ca.ET.045.04.1.1]|uniref:hypothetical protein n=1 Tax=Mesorhizobium sp. M1B.F.Ca.ET.045.04.1.1 TaxID=2493673 RepID=UPI000F74C9FD|nr:hypothetical protein [Mesorhizobium sp. M1B.F.Ca.ET.045.04.1.1]AZO29364.1 hypothetical protein EJ071_19555 [Mesorhizobium sp. M1B.F.Ca.ET.045.04.1.1]